VAKNSVYNDNEKIDWATSIPFFGVHIAAVVGVAVCGFGWKEAIWCFALYFTRMFLVIGGFHRYFAHQSLKMGRVMQFLVAVGGTTACQKGPLWWAAHHRHHHRYSDQEEDVHSPSRRGFWWSHVGWLLSSKYDKAPEHLMKSFHIYPELLWVDRFWGVPPVALACFCTYFGGLSVLFGGFFLSTVIVYHGIFCVNSLAHVWGSRRYATSDTSRNSLFLSLWTLGGGWHNNHHHYQRASCSGFFWWEIDITYGIFKVLSWFGLVWGLHKAPPKVIAANLIAKDAASEQATVRF
jgi:stearoyl-CoA desaturase (delta-9 desaturase)